MNEISKFINIDVLNQIWHSGASYSYINTPRPNYGICYIVSGGIKYKTEKDCLHASCGDIIILPKNCSYKAIFKHDTTQDILINFNCDNLSPCFSDKEITIYKNRTDTEEIFFELLRYHTARGRHFMVISVFFKLLDIIFYSKIDNSDAVKIRQIMENDINFTLNEYDFAKKCAVSISTFQRNFKKYYGKTFSEHRTELKILRAKEFLITGNYTTEQIAEKIGFCDSSYFCKCFKRSTGLTPKQYVNRYYTM